MIYLYSACYSLDVWNVWTTQVKNGHSEMDTFQYISATSVTSFTIGRCSWRRKNYLHFHLAFTQKPTCVIMVFLEILRNFSRFSCFTQLWIRISWDKIMVKTNRFWRQKKYEYDIRHVTRNNYTTFCKVICMMEMTSDLYATMYGIDASNRQI